MRVAYLGIFSWLFDKIFNAILKPIVEFLANILGKVFEFIFNNILMPILTAVLKWFLPYLFKLIKDLLVDVIYRVFAYFCMLLDYAEEVVNIFSGSSKVTLSNGTQCSLLEAIMNLQGVQNVFKTIFIAAMGFAFIFTVYAVIKSTIDIDFEGKRPVGAVIRSFMKCFITFLLVPLVVTFIIAVSSVVLSTINEGARIAGGGNSTTLGRIALLSSTLNACTNDSYNIDSAGFDAEAQQYGGNALRVGPRDDYYSNGADYTKVDDFKKVFDLTKLDFFTGIVVSVFLLVIMVLLCVLFVQRIIEVTILFCVSPFFVATMPLDEGEKFKKWKDLFIGKVFSGYGTVLAMKLFLLFIPAIMGSDIDFNNGGSATESYLFKLLFLCGGAWALYKVGPMVTTLINWQSGSAESRSSDLVGGVAQRGIMKASKVALSATVATTKFAVKAPFKLAAKAIGLDTKKKKGEPTKKEVADALFSAMEDDGLSSKDKDAKKSLMDAAAGAVTSGTKKNSDSASKKKDKPENKEADKKEAENKELENKESENKESENKEAENKENGNKSDAAKPNKNAEAAKKGKGSGKKAGNFAYNLPRKYNSDGTWSISFFGFKSTYDKDGNKVGFSLPFGLAKWKTDANGNYKFSAFKIPGICKCKLGSNNKFSVSNIPMLGIKRQEGKDGQFHVTSALGGVYQQKKGADGVFRTSSVLGVKLGRAYNPKTKDYEVCGIRVGNTVIKGSSAPKSNSEDIVNRIKTSRKEAADNKNKPNLDWDKKKDE